MVYVRISKIVTLNVAIPRDKEADLAQVIKRQALELLMGADTEIEICPMGTVTLAELTEPPHADTWRLNDPSSHIVDREETHWVEGALGLL